MGNRAVITTLERKVGLYLHWNGGRDSVAPFLKYCELKGYRPPSQDCYGWARLSQVVGNFFGGTLSVGLDRYTTDEEMNPGDNGIYLIDGWKIVGRIFPYDDYEEQNEYDFDGMLRSIDRSMPESEQLGEFLDAEEIPVDELSVGDEVWVADFNGAWEHYPVVGFGQAYCRRPRSLSEEADDSDKRPYVACFYRDGDYSWNPNNYVYGETAKVFSRASSYRRSLAWCRTTVLKGSWLPFFFRAGRVEQARWVACCALKLRRTLFFR